MDPRPFHFDYRPPPHNISPTYFSDRVFQFLQPESQKPSSSSRFQNSKNTSRLNSRSLIRDFTDQKDREREIEDLLLKEDVERYEKDKKNMESSESSHRYGKKDLKSQLNIYQRHSSLDQLPERKQNSPFFYEAEKGTPKQSRDSKRSFSSNELIDQYNRNIQDYRLKLLPKARYDPVKGGDFINNSQLLMKCMEKNILVNEAKQKYKGSPFEKRGDQIGCSGDTATAPSPLHQQNIATGDRNQMRDEFYRKYFFDHRRIQSINQRDYNIMNGESKSSRAYEGSREQTRSNSQISQINGFKRNSIYKRFQKPSGFRRLGVKK